MDEPTRGAEVVPVSEERESRADIARIWALCTTKRGLESWWAPEGFVMRVAELDVRKGGPVEFVYTEASAAGDPAWHQQLERQGISTSWRARGVFEEVRSPTHLSFRQNLDFGPQRAPQPFRWSLDLRRVPSGTRISGRAEAAPTKHWKLLGRRNLAGQLDRLVARAERPSDEGPSG